MSDKPDLEAIEARLRALTMERRLGVTADLEVLVDDDVPALIQRVRYLDVARLGLMDALRDARIEVAQQRKRIEALEAQVAALQPDARLGRAVRGMEDNSLLLNASLGSMKHWQRYTDAKVEWMYGDRCQIFAFLVGAGEIREDGYPGDDVWHHTPQAALGLEEGSDE